VRTIDEPPMPWMRLTSDGFRSRGTNAGENLFEGSHVACRLAIEIALSKVRGGVRSWRVPRRQDN
jgi:hypothetical protein